jgi:hypothetical protein
MLVELSLPHYQSSSDALEQPVIVLGNLALVAARILAHDIARGAKLSSLTSEFVRPFGGPK